MSETSIPAAGSLAAIRELGTITLRANEAATAAMNGDYADLSPPTIYDHATAKNHIDLQGTTSTGELVNITLTFNEPDETSQLLSPETLDEAHMVVSDGSGISQFYFLNDQEELAALSEQIVSVQDQSSPLRQNDALYQDAMIWPGLQRMQVETSTGYVYSDYAPEIHY